VLVMTGVLLTGLARRHRARSAPVPVAVAQEAFAEDPLRS